ncbi:inorganic pyrophosphatase [Opitutaceae bacterium EW11]|nr:inorganic pyrophosphatase [Opitutaceae bacterium EW11]
MNLEKLPSFSDDGSLQVVIETPRGSRNKYSFDPESGLFLLRKVLPLGMSFPYDFGFIPGTLAEDGDPLDVLVLMEEPAFAGCLLRCRLLGVIEARQSEGRKSERNDRLIAKTLVSRQEQDDQTLSELPPDALREIEAFFANYNAVDGKAFNVVRRSGPKRAREIIEAAKRGE